MKRLIHSSDELQRFVVDYIDKKTDTQVSQSFIARSKEEAMTKAESDPSVKYVIQVWDGQSIRDDGYYKF